MKLTRGTSVFLPAFGVWSWAIRPTFLRDIRKDPRSRDAGPTAFFTVHLLLVVASLTSGTVIGVLGARGLRAAGSK